MMLLFSAQLHTVFCYDMSITNLTLKLKAVEPVESHTRMRSIEAPNVENVETNL
jgi:hypothetical protein